MKTLSVCCMYHYFNGCSRKKFPHFRDMQNLSPFCGSVGRAFQVFRPVEFQVGPGALGYSQEGIVQPASQVPVAESLPLALRASGFGAHARRGWRMRAMGREEKGFGKAGGLPAPPELGGERVEPTCVVMPGAPATSPALPGEFLLRPRRSRPLSPCRGPGCCVDPRRAGE